MSTDVDTEIGVAAGWLAKRTWDGLPPAMQIEGGLDHIRERWRRDILGFWAMFGEDPVFHPALTTPGNVGGCAVGKDGRLYTARIEPGHVMGYVSGVADPVFEWREG